VQLYVNNKLEAVSTSCFPNYLKHWATYLFTPHDFLCNHYVVKQSHPKSY